LVEHCTENAGVGGSIPPLGTNTSPNISPLLMARRHFEICPFALTANRYLNRRRPLDAERGAPSARKCEEMHT
jgi:hypothetical protein